MGVKVHQRLGSSHFTSSFAAAAAGDRCNKVCFHWQAGRCNRHPCPFLHAELPNSHVAVTSSTSKRNLTWINPNTAGGKGQGGSAAAEGPDRPQADKICRNFMAGSCSFSDKCKFLHTWSVGDGSFSLLAHLEGHQKVIKGITLPPGSDKLYSASHDETVRVWDCNTGQCIGVNNMGGKVDCMISKGPWIFFGLPNSVKAWNTQTETGLSLDGPVGRVYALEANDGMLFAGSEDGRILAWKSSVVDGSHCFEAAASLTGHQRSVVALFVAAGRLYSGSMDTTIRLWDLTTLQCVQTLTDRTSVVMSLLYWDQYLLSCSLDGTVKVWAATDSGKMDVTYTHKEEHGVLALCGMPDAQEKPVLCCALNDNSVRLYDLPSFKDRGKIFAKEEVRSIQVGPGGLFFVGDAAGELKVWKWVVNEEIFDKREEAIQEKAEVDDGLTGIEGSPIRGLITLTGMEAGPTVGGGGEGPKVKPNVKNLNYENLSLRKLKVVYKETLVTINNKGEEKRAALRAIDDNCT